MGVSAFAQATADKWENGGKGEWEMGGEKQLSAVSDQLSVRTAYPVSGIRHPISGISRNSTDKGSVGVEEEESVQAR